MTLKFASSLFRRIFLTLWLGSATLMVGSAIVISAIAEREIPGIVRSRLEMSLRGVARATLLLHGDLDDKRFAEVVETLQREHGYVLYILDGAGKDLLGRSLSPRLRELDARVSQRQDAIEINGPPAGGLIYYGGYLSDIKGRRYKVLMQFLGPAQPSMQFFLRSMLYPLLVSIAIAGFFSALAARYLVKPIDHLRLATKRFAAGELEYRVGDPLRARHDEFGALAGDFDRMADRISQLIGAQRQLMLDLSHELRSPLARMRVALELQRAQPSRQDLIDRMERDTDRMDILIGELLLLARLESPQSSAPASSFALLDLHDLVEEILDDARLEIAGQTRALSCSSAGPDALLVQGDHELLRRAVENIVRNALQHTLENADVSVVLDRQGMEARIRVYDAGAGFSAEARERAFAPFVRGDSARERAGNGLGLAIARAAIQRHGGSIEIENRKDGPGAVVSLRLPLANGDAAAVE